MNHTILTGWQNGRWEMRRIKNGEILFKSQMAAPIAKILVGTFQAQFKIVLPSKIDVKLIRDFYHFCTIV